MIVVDTSALAAIVFDEKSASACKQVLSRDTHFAISAATVSEALILADRRNVGDLMRTLVASLDLEIVPVTADMAALVAGAYTHWGRGQHKAGLNWGDCFAYALAKQRGWALLFVGNDFSSTDIELP